VDIDHSTRPPGWLVQRVPRQAGGPGRRALGGPGPGRATVDLDAIAWNLALTRSRTSSAIMAVVKADAFGHGAAAVARTAVRNGAAWLGVATPAEALELRAAGITAPVLVWIYHPGTDLHHLVAADVDVSVASPAHLHAVARAAAVAGRPAQVHLKIDTGLSRSGATAGGWPALTALARRLERADRIRVRGLWTHLVDADTVDAAAVPGQMAAFTAAVAEATRAGLRPSLLHAANSGAALHRPDTHLDLVRCGIGLYGVEPLPERPVGLRPAMTLEAPIVLTKRVPAGTGVSYHHDYVTASPTTLALVSLGYADGVPRAASGRAHVWIDGRRCRVAGRIAMDQFVVDVGGTEPGSGSAVIFGPGAHGEPTVAEWAAWAGTIPHEIMTGIGRRVARHSIGGCVRDTESTEELAVAR
jgi:alanine racemase